MTKLTPRRVRPSAAGPGSFTPDATPGDQFGFVNTPVYRGSTVLFRQRRQLQDRRPATSPTARTARRRRSALETAWTELCGAAGTVLAPSGLAAVTLALMAVLDAGDHVLVTDSAYGRRASSATRC